MSRDWLSLSLSPRSKPDVSFGMDSKRRALAGILVFLLVGAGVPFLELWLKCRQPMSEACVWAKAYLPLSLGIGAVLGILAAVVAWFVLGAWRGK